jgi:hypothetical protein
MSFILGLYRQVANLSVAPISVPRYGDFINQSVGGSLPMNGTPANWTGILYNSIMIYPDAFGIFAFVILTIMPFGMMWITNGNMKMAGILGLIVGMFAFAYLPAGFVVGAEFCIGISAVATLWGIFKG